MASRNPPPKLQQGWLRLPRRRALCVGPAAGRLEVAAGSVWVTLAGERQDFFIGVGQGMALLAGDDAVVESTGEGDAILNWRPDPVAAASGIPLPTLRRGLGMA